LSATPIRRQAAQSFETVPAGFHRLRAGLFNHEKVWMFDNEIDWVMRIWHLSLVPAAQKAVGRVSAQMTQYKAEHKQ